MPIALIIWNNRKIIGEILAIIGLLVLCWWFFIHNPKVIKDLENDKAELSRQLEAGQKAIKLLETIQQGKVVIDAAIQGQISTMRATARPKRTVIIHAGVPLSTMHKTNPPN